MAKYINNKEVENDMVKMYSQGLKLQEIANQYGGISITTVYKVLKAAGTEFKQRYDYKDTWKFKIKDINYFDNIDTEEKAYFLGFLYADGNVHGDKNRVSLKLHKKDEEILIAFSKLIYESYTIRRDGKYVEFAFYNNKMVQDIIKAGCMPNKTFKIKFPSNGIVPNRLLHHFIRGYFDGDGSVGKFYSKKDNKRVNFSNVCGTKHFCKGLLEILRAFNPFMGGRIDDQSNDNICVLRFSSNNVLRFYLYLYQDAHIFLNRKHEKFKEEALYFLGNVKRRENNRDVYDLLIKKIPPMNNFGL